MHRLVVLCSFPLSTALFPNVDFAHFSTHSNFSKTVAFSLVSPYIKRRQKRSPESVLKIKAFFLFGGAFFGFDFVNGKRIFIDAKML